MDAYQGCKPVLFSPGAPPINKCVKLNSGACMPIIGYGTYKLHGKESIRNSVDAALQSGYKLFDTAPVYGNLEILAEIFRNYLPKYKLERKDIFIVSKLSPSDHGDRVGKAVQDCMASLGIDYIDLFLIHWPGAAKIDVTSSKNSELRLRSWMEMEKLHDNGNGVLKSIGVSNYTVRHLRELLNFSAIKPAVNQVEFHPYFQHNDDFYEICAANDIVLQAYSSLGGGNNSRLINDPTILSISEKLKKTPGQVLLRWALQAGYAIIPKSQTPKRILENTNLDFPIYGVDFKTIQKIRHRQKYAWDPDTVV